MAEQVWVGEELYEKLDKARGKGQSFAGYIRELIEETKE